jgi:hypothetical protein
MTRVRGFMPRSGRCIGMLGAQRHELAAAVGRLRAPLARVEQVGRGLRWLWRHRGIAMLLAVPVARRLRRDRPRRRWLSVLGWVLRFGGQLWRSTRRAPRAPDA